MWREIDAKTWTGRNRHALMARLADEAELLDGYETLIRDLAQEQIEALLVPALHELAQLDSLPYVEVSERWPFVGPVSEAGFLRQLMWARHASDFWRVEDQFLHVIRRVCKQVIRAHVIAGELPERTLSAASFIENGPSGPESWDWIGQQLSRHVWQTLRDHDISILDDLGVDDPFAARSDDEEDD